MDLQKTYKIEEGKIILLKTKWSKEREVATCSEETQDTVIEKLIEAFGAIQKEWEEFTVQFQEEKEPVKLAGKLSRKKSFFSEAKAVGDYEPIFKEIEEIESKIEARVLDVLKQKQAFVAQIHSLTETTPDTNTKWKEATEQMAGFKRAFLALPQVPHPDDEPLRDKLNEATNHFFNEKEKHYEDFKLELAANLDRKLELCERAEGIKESDDWRKTTDTYKQLMELWKAVGPVPRHKSEELWMRFNSAKDHFFTNKQKFYDELIGNLEENLKAKEELIKQTEEIKESTDWKKTTDKMNELMEAWKKIGGVGKEKNDEIWGKFSAARDVFFTNKKNHFAGRKVEMENNLAKKIAIVKRAEELKTSEDFEAAGTEYQELMTEWKATGFAGKKEGDEQWNKFIEARKHFYERRDVWRDDQREVLLEDINNKIGKNIGFMNKLKKELSIEQDVLTDFQDRVKNIAPSARSFESKERYEKTIEEAKQKVEKLEKKIADVQAKVNVDKKERGRLYYWQKRKEEQEQKENPEAFAEKMKEKEAKRKERAKERTAKGNKKTSKPNKPQGPTLLGSKLKGLNLNFDD